MSSESIDVPHCNDLQAGMPRCGANAWGKVCQSHDVQGKHWRDVLIMTSTRSSRAGTANQRCRIVNDVNSIVPLRWIARLITSLDQLCSIPLNVLESRPWNIKVYERLTPALHLIIPSQHQSVHPNTSNCQSILLHHSPHHGVRIQAQGLDQHRPEERSEARG